ncbi:MAG: TraB/GumN family protein, partial [Methylomonas sp.]
RLRKQADALCIAYDTIAKYTPEMQAATLSIMVGRWDGLYSEFAIDSILAVSGHAANKNMVSLETPEIQLRSLTGATPEAGVHMVEDTLDDIESGRSRTMTNRLANDWATSNFTEFDHFSDWCECLNTDSEREMMKQLLDKRNPNLADKIDNLVSSGKHVFAAVGALHLFGPQGLPTLLAERGYQVERVAFN